MKIRKATITHEIGHVLKLKHPSENGIPINSSTFPAVMQSGAMDQSGSNYYLSMHGYQSHTITVFDMAALVKKWNG